MQALDKDDLPRRCTDVSTSILFNDIDDNLHQLILHFDDWEVRASDAFEESQKGRKRRTQNSITFFLRENTQSDIGKRGGRDFL